MLYNDISFRDGNLRLLLPVSSQARIVKGVSLLYMFTQVVSEIIVPATQRVKRSLYFAESEADPTLYSVRLSQKTILCLGGSSGSGRLICSAV